MKTKTAQSVKTPLYRWLTLFAAICLCVSMFYLLWTAFLSDRNSTKANEQTLRSYASNLDNVLQQQRGFSESLTVNNIQFRTLGQSNCTQQQRIVAEHALAELLRSQTPRYGISLVYHAGTKRALFYYGENVKDAARFLESAAAMHRLGELVAGGGADGYRQWRLLDGGETGMLMLVNRYNDLYFCTLLDLRRYVELYPVVAYAEREQTVVYTEDAVLLAPPQWREEALAPALWSRTGTFHSLRCKASCTRLAFAPVGIALVTPTATILGGYLPNAAFFLLVVVLMGGFFHKLLQYLDRSLLFPLEEIAAQTARLSGEQSPQKLESGADFKEYIAIRSALNELLEKKKALEEQSYANRIQKEHALLQYYQLQTRSHFFSNCLKSLYSMAEKSNRAQMQTMIISFSNHLRYIFKDNLNLVTLQDELNEVADYHRIITLDLPRPFLLTQNVPKELLDANVPPLIIQTFLENTYKYAKDGPGVLVFRIEASEVTFQGAPYLRLHLWDNGNGYPQDVLESINASQRDIFADYHVGINNLIHRMSLLYGEAYQAAFYNEERGNANSLLYLPLWRGRTSQAVPEKTIKRRI